MLEPRSRLPGERAFSVLLLAASLLLLYLAYRISGFSSVSSPGVFPMAAAAVMVVSLVVVLLGERGAKAATVGPAAFFRRVTPPVLLATVALMAALMLLIEPAGFLPAAGGFLFASMLVLQRGQPLRAALVSAVSLAAIYAVFRLVFKVVLPEAEWL